MRRGSSHATSTATVTTAAKGFELLSSQVQACQEVGLFPHIPYPDAAQTLWAATHGYVSLEILGVNLASDLDDVFRRFLAATLDGLQQV